MSGEAEGRESAPRHEVAAVVCGLLVFVASFMPWYAVTVEGPAEAGVTGTYNAWHGLAGVGILLVLFSLVITATEPFLGEDGSLPTRILAAIAACVGAVLVVARSFDLPSSGIPAASETLRWGGWALVVLVILQALISVLRVVHTGDH